MGGNGGCVHAYERGGLGTHPHSRAGSSRSSTFGKRWSRNALSSAYSLSAVRIGCASNVPIQPRRRVLHAPLPLELYLRVFHVTKSGLYIEIKNFQWRGREGHAQFVVGEGGLDGLCTCQRTVESVEGVEAVLGAARGRSCGNVVIGRRWSSGLGCCRLLVEGANHVDWR
jgi:hypothetical protein